ncbi:MAG: PaaI family thioesterase [Burkholderiaceae bacterium]
MTSEQARTLLTEVFAPWVQRLGLEIVSIDASGATLWLPASTDLARDNGVVCGQALMAAADTAMVFAISAAAGGYRPMTTVEQKTTFMRPVVGSARIEAHVLRLSKSMAFGSVDVVCDEKLAAQATTTYALL